MRRFLSVFLCILLLLTLAACNAQKEQQPITLTIWHVYGGQTDSPLNDLIEEFNQTVGKEHNITV